MITQYLIAFFCYFSILLVIGIVSHRKQSSNAAFIVGNRSLNFWLTALSAHASDMSAWIFMGLPMAIYLTGLSGSWIAIGLVLGMFLNWQFVSIKLRTETEKYNAFTLSSFFENRFKDTSGILRVLTACILIFFLTHYLSAALMAMGLLLESVFGIDYYYGLAFSLGVVVVYTFGGGFITIAWTDLFQATFLLGVIILVPVVAYFSMEDGWTAIKTIDENKTGYLSLLGNSKEYSLLTAIFLAASWGLGYYGQPHIITKFMGINNSADLKKSKYVGMSWQVLALTASIFVGIVGAAFFDYGLENPELVFIEMVKILFHPLVAGFILCGILAANLSTMDSQLLVGASAFSEDLYKRLFHPSASPLELVRLSRFGVVLIATVALFIAFMKNETIIDSVLYAWAGLGSSFGPLVLTSLYYKRTNKYGAITGIIVGCTLAICWHWINPMLFETVIPTMVAAFTLSTISIIVVSMLTSNKSVKSVDDVVN
jgi:sodium/proline symporter